MVWGLLPVSLGTDSLLSPEIHKEAGDSSLRLLQEHHQWLERYPQWPAGPVSTMAPGLGWIPGVCPPVLGRGHSPATSRHWLMGALTDLSPHGLSPPRYNEINAISTACSYGITECQDLATDYLRQWQQNVTNNP